jgi:hypothetical protein
VYVIQVYGFLLVCLSVNLVFFAGKETKGGSYEEARKES